MNVLYSASPCKKISGRYISVLVPVKWFVLAPVLRKVGHTTENTDVVCTSLFSAKEDQGGSTTWLWSKSNLCKLLDFHINTFFFPSFFTLNEHDQNNKICVGAYISARILRQY